MQTEWSMLDAAPNTETGFPASYEEATDMDIALFMRQTDTYRYDTGQLHFMVILDSNGSVYVWSEKPL
jgi:hypothetical protein